MTLEQLSKLKKAVGAHTKITPDNVMEKSLEIPNIHSKLLNLYYDEKKELKRMKSDLAVLYRDAYVQAKFHSDYNLTTKTDFDTFAMVEEKYHKAKIECDNQELVVEYIEKAMDSVSKLGFHIKSYIELLKIKNGIVS